MYYKCFNKNLTNVYGYKFNDKTLYHVQGDIKFGSSGNGFHVCKRLEDTLRFFDGFHENIEIARVNCFGKHEKIDDDYNEYFDMYVFEFMYIEKILTREEIIKYALKLPYNRVTRFISSIKLTEEEIELFKNKFSKELEVINTIKYYQENDKDAFKRRLYHK